MLLRRYMRAVALSSFHIKSLSKLNNSICNWNVFHSLFFFYRMNFFLTHKIAWHYNNYLFCNIKLLLLLFEFYYFIITHFIEISDLIFFIKSGTKRICVLNEYSSNINVKSIYSITHQNVAIRVLIGTLLCILCP